jgi:hypothetical protein
MQRMQYFHIIGIKVAGCSGKSLHKYYIELHDSHIPVKWDAENLNAPEFYHVMVN